MLPINAKGHEPSYVLAAEQLRKNKGQWQAYDSSGSCVILAGPGSGKTKTITIKLARMLAEDVRPPRGIACITYSNQCARELKKRLSNLGVQDGNRSSIGTLHSFCLKHIVIPYAQLAGIKKKYPLSIVSTRTTHILQQKAVDRVIGTHQRWGPEFDKYRRRYLDRKSTDWLSVDEEKAKTIELYESYLDDQGLIDFDGMMLIGLHLVKTNEWIRKALVAKFPILVIDEYQDLGYPLHQLVECLCTKTSMRLIAVGDPDQSIYGFTGADPELLMKLSKAKGIETIRLKLNYRCGSAIIQASEVALGEKRNFESGCNEPGVVYFHDCPGGIQEQAELICESIIPTALKNKKGRKIGDIAIQYLDKNDGNIFADAINKRGWQYIRIDGNNPYQPSPVTYWLEECAAWCSSGWKTGEPRLSEILRRWFVFNERISSDLEKRLARIKLVRYLHNNRLPDASLHNWLQKFMQVGLSEALNKEPQLGDDKEKVMDLIKATAPKGPLEAFTVAFFGGQSGSPSHLNLTTLHSAKGLEYDVVIMPGLEQGRIPYYKDSGEMIREKRRLFYVGLTRARHEVHLMYSGHYIAFGNTYKNGRSIFVSEVESSITSH